MLESLKEVFTEVFAKKIPSLAPDFEPVSTGSRRSLLLTHKDGPKLVASILGDLAAIVSKLLWHRPELSQSQLSGQPTAMLTNSRYGTRW